MWFVSPLLRFRVSDHSMEPSFREDDFVVVNRLAYRFRPPEPGDVVVLRNPEDRSEFLLKRIASVSEEGAVEVRGDNGSNSRDSRHFGAVQKGLIVGKVWFHARR